MKRLAIRTLFAAATATMLGFATDAAGVEDFVSRLLGHPPGKGKTYACFTRVYDPAHLASHPQQNVRSMILLVVVDSESPDIYQVRIGSHFRSREGLLDSEGDCGVPDKESDADNPAGSHCGVACDGGAIDVALKDKDAMLLSIPEGARLWKPGDDDTIPAVRGAFGPDDKLFRLDRSPAAECAEEGADATEKALLKRMR
jgi:hypothetical protein